MKIKLILFIISTVFAIFNLDAQKKPVIDNSRFEISPTSASFSEVGGVKTFTVTADTWSLKNLPDTWAHLITTDKTIKLSVDENNSYQDRTTSFIVTSLGREITIRISQSAASKLEVTPMSYTFAANGGTKTFSINSTDSWNIGKQPESFGILTRNGNNLILKVETNKRTSSRSDYFTITSNGKSVTVNFSQSASEAKFSISPSYASFGAEGGTKTFTITSNDSWQIDENTAKWGHLKQNGNKLTLKVDAYSLATTRNDFFIIKSGDKKIRVNISQSGATQRFEISSTTATFGVDGGEKTFTITSTNSWQIVNNPTFLGYLTKNGNSLTLRVDANKQTSERTDYFIIESGGKQIRVDIKQDAFVPYLTVNGSTNYISLTFDKYGIEKNISVSTNAADYEISGKPYWCYINSKNAKGFKLGCNINNSSNYRTKSLNVKTKDKEVRINISQEPDFRKYRRRVNGGWVNMALGLEGGYSFNKEDKSWYTNGIVGLRFGNYRDLFQFELGAAPGEISFYEEEPVFHLPIYCSFKLSSSYGKFYMKIGGSYNIIREEFYEGEYSLRAGFGSAWKHFEWDWAFVQFNAPSDYYEDVRFSDLFDASNMIVGMRMAWYITR